MVRKYTSAANPFGRKGGREAFVPPLRRPIRSGKPSRVTTRGRGVINPNTLPGGWTKWNWRRPPGGGAAPGLVRNNKYEIHMHNGYRYWRIKSSWRPPPASRPTDMDVDDMTVPGSGVTNNTGITHSAPTGHTGTMPGRYSRYSKRRGSMRGKSAYGRIPKGELKFVDTARASLLITSPTDAAGAEANPTVPGTVALNGVAVGTGQNERIGNVYRPQSIKITGKIILPVKAAQAATDQECEVMLALVMDKNSNGLACRSEDVFTNPGGAAQSATDAFPNLNFRNRFVILKTLKFRPVKPQVVADTATTIASSGTHTPWAMNVSLTRFGKQVVNGTDATFASMPNNALNLVVFCSSVATTPSVIYNARMRYYDN